MTPHRFLVLLFLSVAICGERRVTASPESSFFEFLAKQAVKETAEETAQQVSKEVIVKEVGEAVLERVTADVVREGGEESLTEVATLTAKHGSDIIRALDNSPAVVPILAAFDDLPADQVSHAAARLAAGPQGKELAETTIRYGAAALRAEVAHPGVGGHFVKALGRDGALLCERLTADQAIALGGHVDDIAALPPSQRTELLRLISAQTDRFVQFVGRFVEQNPGKVVFTTAITGVILSESERVLGGDEIVISPDGKPVVASKPGIVGKAGQATKEALLDPLGEGISWLARGVASIVFATIGAVALIKLWSFWRRQAHR
jgi:hypothetical protein